MDPRDLLTFVLAEDSLRAREWVSAAQNAVNWSAVPWPAELDSRELAVFAGLVEMLAERANMAPPDWTASVGPSADDVYLVARAKKYARVQRQCREESPEPLKRRQVYALQGFLSVT